MKSALRGAPHAGKASTEQDSRQELFVNEIIAGEAYILFSQNRSTDFFVQHRRRRKHSRFDAHHTHHFAYK